MVKRWDLQGYSFTTERGQYVKHSDYAQQEIALHHWIDVAGGYRCRIDQLQSELDVLGGVHTHSPGCEKTALCRVTNERDRLRAELADATAWRPISTAPTGVQVLIWRAHSTAPTIARYDPIYEAFEDVFGDPVYNVTHWMPLPAAPNEIDAALAAGSGK